MALSRSTRITILLVLVSIFCVIELGVGYYVHSLALVADSFHMLSDVLSMVIALYAIKLASRGVDVNDKDQPYTFGFQRAEILAALVNGVFLLALCFSIIVEALSRFYSPSEVSNPKMVVVVGCIGLFCNLVGIFLFHEHGDEDHSKDTAPNKPHHHELQPRSEDQYALLDEEDKDTEDIAADAAEAIGHDNDQCNVEARAKRLGANRIYAVSKASGATPPPQYDSLQDPEAGASHSHSHSHSQSHSHSHGHSHSLDGHGHGHGSMNMRALLIHVAGDALSNIGVIVSGLVMWLTQWGARFYLDPAVSLFISVLICLGTVPLVRSTARILLQAAPYHVSPSAVRTAALAVPGVTSIHDLRLWQLSEASSVASLHVEIELPSSSSDEKSGVLAVTGVVAEIRRRLRELGVQEVTVQPEFVLKDAISLRVKALEEEVESVDAMSARTSDETLYTSTVPR